MPPVVRLTGTIKSVRRGRGFAFIRGDDGEEYFAHASGLGGFHHAEWVTAGRRCTFEPAPAEHGKFPQAVRVQVLDDPSASSD